MDALSCGSVGAPVSLMQSSVGVEIKGLLMYFFESELTLASEFLSMAVAVAEHPLAVEEVAFWHSFVTCPA